MYDVHPLAPAHLPWFISGPGQTDYLLIAAGTALILSIFGFGILYLRLHHLPEHIAQKQQKVQYQVVAVLGLLAMLTHQNAFWVAGLLLALVDLPNIGGYLAKIAQSVERIPHSRIRKARGARQGEKAT
jgi:ABC-type Na+ efflux pump permease subunit